MNSSSTNLVYVDAAGWIALVNRQIYRQLLQEQSSRIEVVHLTPELYAKGWELYSHRLDKDWGAIDCISFVIMQERNLTEALTSDHHFEQAGFKILL